MDPAAIRPLWLALRFPQLPLEVFSAHAPAASALAVSDREQTGPCNAAARELGVRPGLRLTEARARAPGLLLLPRDRERERETLEGLALWAREFTSQVSLHGDNVLFLELAGSLTLFGDLHSLVARITEGCRVLGHHCQYALAPSAAAALLLARARRQLIITDDAELPAALAPLPVGLTEHGASLRGLGLLRLGQCLQLPRAELGQRFGAPFIDWLDQLLGRCPWPLQRWQPPESFCRQLTLPAETRSSEALGFAFHRLLLELGSFLRVRVKGVELLSAQMFHRKHSVTEFTVSLSQAEQNPRHLNDLLQQRLQRLSLPAPVHEIRLRSEVLSPLPSRPASLFEEISNGDWQQLADRLRARLGREAVTALGLTEDYRPERQQHLVPLGAPAVIPIMPVSPGRRPLWLLDPARPLDHDQGLPLYNGRLELVSDIERIETGWWEASLAAARDYYIARGPDDGLLWVFRERSSGRWYLHGIFA